MEQRRDPVAGAVGRGVRGPAWLNRLLLKIIGPASVGTGAAGPAREKEKDEDEDEDGDGAGAGAPPSDPGRPAGHQA